MNVNDGLLALEKVFPQLLVRPTILGDDQGKLVAQRLHELADYYDRPVKDIIYQADQLGLRVTSDGLVYVRH